MEVYLIEVSVSVSAPSQAQSYVCYRLASTSAFPICYVDMFMCILRRCTSLKDLEKGHVIHGEITAHGFTEKSICVGTSLVDMYAKCGSFTEARNVLESLCVRNVVSWTSLIAGYVEHGYGEEALCCVKDMQREVICLNEFTFVCCLKACGLIQDSNKGLGFHGDTLKIGLSDVNVYIGSSLVDMYCKCGSIQEAQQVFQKITFRNVVTWTALIVGLLEHGYGDEALYRFKEMKLHGISANSITCSCGLKACCSILALDEEGREIHGEIVKKGFECEMCIGNSLVDLYAKYGHLDEAKVVFNKLPSRDVVSWTTLISGYVEQGCPDEALFCFEQMQQKGVFGNSITFTFSLKACNCIARGRRMHIEVIKRGFEDKIVIGSGLVHMYGKCNFLLEAQHVLGKLTIQDVFPWTALISSCVELGDIRKALHYSEEMKDADVSRNVFTLMSILKCCVDRDSVEIGQGLHAEIIMRGLETDVRVATSLVHFYGKSGWFSEAKMLCLKLVNRSVATWNALIAGYTEHGLYEEVLNCVESMRIEGISSDIITFVCSIKACGSIWGTRKGQNVHVEIMKKGLEMDLLVGNSLIYMYSKSGLLKDAHKVFNDIRARDVISWTTLMTGYAENGHEIEAHLCFQHMQNEAISINNVAFICLLKACLITHTNQVIHSFVVHKGLEDELLLANSLIDMYANCGLLQEAQEVFGRLPCPDITSWNALMAGYCLLGESACVFSMFNSMMREDIKPNLVTYLIVLNACNHGGLVEEGMMCFEAINIYLDLAPPLQHYACIVNLLGRAGHVAKAVAITKEMPFQPKAMIWHVVLGACRKFSNLEFAQLAFDHAIGLDKTDVIAFVCMSNIYVGTRFRDQYACL